MMARILRRAALPGVLLFLAGACAPTQRGGAAPVARSEGAEISTYILREMDTRRIPGLQLVIARDGHVVYSEAFGFADLAHSVPVTDTTRFQSGSIGKTATALGMALLARDGALALNDPLTRFFPDAPEPWHAITVLDLVDQTSGLQDPDLGWTEDFSEADYLQAAYAAPLASPPGRYHAYQNVNFDLAGMITARVTGRRWVEFQRDRIFEPLGMSRTHGVKVREIVPAAARGYQWEDGRFLQATPVFSQSVGDLARGSLWTTASDWTRVLNSYLGSALFPRAYTDSVLLANRQLDTGHPINYSFGNGIGSINGHRAIEHGGGTPGFRAFAILYPDKRTTLVMMANTSFDVRSLAHHVAGLFDPELRVPVLSEVEVNDLQRFEGRYYFPSWGETEFRVEEGRLILDAGWFRDECRMYGPAACTPGDEVRFEFQAREDGSFVGIVYRDSAYDLGWWIDRVDDESPAGETPDR